MPAWNQWLQDTPFVTSLSFSHEKAPGQWNCSFTDAVNVVCLLCVTVVCLLFHFIQLRCLFHRLPLYSNCTFCIKWLQKSHLSVNWYRRKILHHTFKFSNTFVVDDYCVKENKIYIFLYGYFRIISTSCQTDYISAINVMWIHVVYHSSAVFGLSGPLISSLFTARTPLVNVFGSILSLPDGISRNFLMPVCFCSRWNCIRHRTFPYWDTRSVCRYGFLDF